MRVDFNVRKMHGLIFTYLSKLAYILKLIFWRERGGKEDFVPSLALLITDLGILYSIYERWVDSLALYTNGRDGAIQGFTTCLEKQSTR